MRLAVLTSPGRTLIIPPHLPNEDYQTKSFSAIFIAIILIFQATAQFFTAQLFTPVSFVITLKGTTHPYIVL